MTSPIGSIVAVVTLISLVSANMDPTCYKLPNAKHPLECCNEPKLFPADKFAKCAAEFPPSPMPPPSGKMKGCCMSECVLNATKINTNGLPDFEKAIEVIDKVMGNDAEFMPVVTKAIHECAKKSKELEPYFLETMKAQDDGEKVCHPQSGFLIGCFYGKVFSDCPASRWTSNSDCDAIKHHVNKCEFLLPMAK